MKNAFIFTIILCLFVLTVPAFAEGPLTWTTEVTDLYARVDSGLHTGNISWLGPVTLTNKATSDSSISYAHIVTATLDTSFIRYKVDIWAEATANSAGNKLVTIDSVALVWSKVNWSPWETKNGVCGKQLALDSLERAKVTSAVTGACTITSIVGDKVNSVAGQSAYPPDNLFIKCFTSGDDSLLFKKIVVHARVKIMYRRNQ